MTAQEVKHSRCYFCHDRCAVNIYVENGKAVKIEGDKESDSQGMICVKGRSAIEHLYHEDRLNFPLKRVGERGENKWQRIPWEDAVSEIAEKLQRTREKYGAESLAISEGTDRTYLQFVMFAFLHLFGSPNFICDGTICYMNTLALDTSTYGWFPGHAYSVTKAGIVPGATKCIVVWGQNPSESHPSQYRDIINNQKAGTKVIIIDPRQTPVAKRADLWLPLRPATDGALALGWLNVIIEEELYDKEFADKWCYGFDKLKDRVREYPPEKVSDITGLSEELIINSARMYANNKPAMIAYGLSTDQIGRNSSQAIRAKAILRAITGNLDVEGGEILGFPDEQGKIIASSDLDCADKLPKEQKEKQLGSERFRFQSFPGYEIMSEPYNRVWKHKLPAYGFSFANSMYVWDAILNEAPYPVKAFIAVANNTLLSRANTRKVYNALKKLDLMVVSDYWMTPTAELADYVMPAADWMERPNLTERRSGIIGSLLIASEAAVSPLCERHSDYDFFRALAQKLELSNDFPWGKSYEELCDYRLAPIGITFKELVDKKRVAFDKRFKKYETDGFATPTGKVELYSTVFEKLGYEPLPFYEEPAESPVRTPELLQEYPLILSTSPRHIEAYHSEQRQIRSLRMKHPSPLVELNENTAKQLNVNEGDWVYIETRRGRIRMRAKLSADIPQNVVMPEHGWWFPEEPGEEPFLHGLWTSNANLLTDDSLDNCDPLCGGWTNRGLLCRVYPVKQFA